MGDLTRKLAQKVGKINIALPAKDPTFRQDKGTSMADFKKILAFDSAMNACSAGLCVDGKVSSKTQAMTSGQGEHLIPLIQNVMREGGVEFPNLDAIVTTLGPGAFTGLRIGLSTAQSFGLALNIPVFGITTLQAIASCYAAQNKNARKLMALVETKREDFYVQTFSSSGEALTPPKAAMAEEIMHDMAGDYMLMGDGVRRFSYLLNKEFVTDEAYMLPDTGFIAQLLQKNPKMFSRDLAPVYLRSADVNISKQVQRILAGT
jgi:tRNA threonylcarbamoyladenosine biosynthesis protein TsaB